jgi:hypothetical protein
MLIKYFYDDDIQIIKKSKENCVLSFIKQVPLNKECVRKIEQSRLMSVVGDCPW